LGLRGAPDSIRFDGPLVGTSSRPVDPPAADGRRCSSRAPRLIGALRPSPDRGGRTMPWRSGAPRHRDANNDKGERTLMKRLLIAVGIAAIALAVGVGTATAADPSGGAQGTGQLAGTLQGAPSTSQAGQTASNTGLPAGFSGSGLAISPGSSSATQDAGNSATSNSSNDSTTGQKATGTQTGGSSSCASGCGGAGQAQTIDQAAVTKQDANADAKAKQNAVNANVPVSIADGNVSGGSSSADQTATNAADASADNNSKTKQTADATQTGGSSSCKSGCGGNGQEQNVAQDSKTKQDASADAQAKQNAVNANAPVGIAGDGKVGG